MPELIDRGRFDTRFFTDGPRSMQTRTKAIGILLALSGFVFGIGLFAFSYARGASYLVDDPQACANCHVMNDQYFGWQAGPHRNVATCNSCHTPADFAGKYTTKALNGFFHAYAFTTGRFPDPIRITERNRKIAENACRNCHQPMTALIDHGGQTECRHCHADMGH